MNTNKDTVLRAILERLQGALSSHLLRNLAEEEVRLVGSKPQKGGNTVAQRSTVNSARPTIATTQVAAAIWGNFPRSVPGYASMINLLCDCCYDTTVFFNYLMCWLSDKVTPLTPFDYHSFVTSIATGPLKPTQQEPVDLVINIVVADIIATLYSRREPQPPEQLQQLAEYLFKFPFLYQSLRAEPNNTLRAMATTQWSCVLGLISPSILNYGPQNFLATWIVKMKSEPTFFWPFLKNIRLSLRTEKETQESTMVIEKFMALIFNAYNQKNQNELKLFLSIYCDVLSSIDLSEKPDIFTKAKIDSKSLEKMVKSEDTESVAIKYKAVLMAVGVNDYFTGNVQEVTQKILKRVGAHSKYSDEFLEALAILFRGAHYGVRIAWLPSVDQSKETEGTDLFVARRLPSHLFPDGCRIVEGLSPFLHAPFFEKMRIQKQASFEILRGFLTRNLLSSKFKLWSNSKINTQAVADVIVQAATHSFDYLTQEILPTLLGGTICDAIVALQSLAMLVSPTLKYSTLGHCFQADKKEPGSITAALNQEIVKTINASIRVLASNIDLTDQSAENRDNVGCYLTPGTFHFKGFESLFAQAIEAQRPSIAFASIENNRGKIDGQKNSLLPLSHLDEILKGTLARVQRLVYLGEAERREKHYKGLIQHSKKTAKAIESWISSDCSFGYPNFVTGPPVIPEEPKPRVRRPAKDERLRAYQVLLLKEMLQSVLTLPPSDWQYLQIIPFGNDKIKPVPLLAYMILHQDDELSNLVFHYYQRVIVEYPQFRTIVIADLIQVFHSIHFSKQHLKLFVFTQISVLLDLWNSVYYSQIPSLNRTENKANSNIIVSEGELENIIILIQNLEQCSLYFLCSTIPEFRLCSLDILHSVSLLSFLHCRNTLEDKDQIRMSSIIRTHQHFILQESRLTFLQELSINIHDFQRNRHDTPLEITIREIAGSTHERLWTFVLSQIGRALAMYDDSSSIVRLKTMGKILDDFEIDNYLNSQQVQAVANTDGLENGVLFIPTLYSNCQLFLFSLANSKLQSDQQTGVQKILRHLVAWGDLLAENVAIVLSRVQAIKMISWDSATVILASLWQWYSKIQPKKKADIRPYIAYILYSISLHCDFQKGITLCRSVGQCYIQFIEEVVPAFEPLSKSSDLSHTFYYLSNTGIIINLMHAMHKSIELSLIGPLRKQFLSQPHWVLSEQWQTKHRVALVSFFRDRIHLDPNSQRLKNDRGEIEKMMNKASEKEAKEKIRIVTTRHLKIIADRSAQAIEALARVFHMVEVPNAMISSGQANIPKFVKEIEGWIMPVQRLSPSNQILPWLVAHEEDIIPGLLEKAYVTIDILDKVFYSHSIYAQFVSSQYYKIDTKYHNGFKKTESKLKDQKGMIDRYSTLQTELKQSLSQGMQTNRIEPGGDLVGLTSQPFMREEVIYNADSFYYKTTHTVMDQFIESRIIDEEIYNSSLAPLTSYDMSFSKKVVGLAGQLLNFLFYSLIQPEISIRSGAFYSLLRLGPIEFGKCVEIPETPSIKRIRLSIARYEANINSPIDEVWFSAAVAISDILCNNCAEYTLDFVTAWIDNYKYLTPLEQVRTSAIIQRWGKNISVSESGPIGSTFLESLFATVTIVACEERNVVSASIFSVWESFSIVSTSNMAYVVKFLVLRGVTKGHIEICRRLIPYLAMKAHRSTVLDSLLCNLSFQGMMENINRANQERLSRQTGDQPKSPRSIEGPTLQNPQKKASGRGTTKQRPQQQQEQAPKKKEEKTSMEQIFSLMRKASTAMLADLIGDDINSMFPSLHIILQYTFLYIDQDNHLLHVLATILRQIMAIFINGMTKENQESVTECIDIIKNILTCMQVHRHSFINWDVTAMRNAGEQRETQQNILKGFPATQLPQQSTRESTFVGDKKYEVHSKFLDLLSHKIHISNLVDYIIHIFNHPIILKCIDDHKKPGPGVKNVIHLWGQQCVLWGILFPDSLISTKSLELYSRIVKPCSMETIIKLATNLHYSVERLQTISTVSKAIQKGALISEFFTPDAQDVDILRVRVQVLVESLIHIAKTTDSEHYSQFLFWVSCGLMEASPLTHPAVYNCGVNLLGAVVESKTFASIEPNGFKSYLKLSESWKFPGLNKLLVSSMKSGKSETIGASLIRRLLTVDNIPVELFEGQRKANLELQDALWFLSILPWLHYNLYLPYYVATNCGDEFSSRNAARSLLRGIFEKFNQPSKKFQYSVYKFITKFNSDYITNKQKSSGENTFNSFPFSLSTSTAFLAGISQVLAAYFFPVHSVPCFTCVLDLFTQLPKTFHNILATITAEFLQAASKDASIKVPGILTDILVAASKDVELSESGMTKKLISFEHTSDSNSLAQKWYPPQLQNVEVSLQELVNHLKARSNRHSVMQQEQGGEKGDKKLAKQNSKGSNKLNSNNQPPTKDNKKVEDASQVQRGRMNVTKPTVPQGAQPSSSSRPTSNWIGARSEDVKARTDSRNMSGFATAKPTAQSDTVNNNNNNKSVDDLSKTRSTPNVRTSIEGKKPATGLTDSTGQRERLIRIQQKVSVGADAKPSSTGDFSQKKPSSGIKQSQTTVIDDGLASLRQLAGTLQFSLSSSDSDSYSSGSDEEPPKKRNDNDKSDDSDDFIEDFRRTSDEFNNMRALLMNSVTANTDNYDDDDDSDTYETESDNSDLDDLDDLRTSLAGLENF